MSDTGEQDGSHGTRCPRCDSVIQDESQRCIMCGYVLSAEELGEAKSPRILPGEAGPSEEVSQAKDIEEPYDQDLIPAESEDVVVSEMTERTSPVTFWLTALFAIVLTTLGIVILRNPADATLEFIPTETPIPAVSMPTAIPTLLSTATAEPVESPTATPSPLPTNTLPPPRSHTVAAGETLFGISLRYGVSMESITALNNLPANPALQVSQQLLVPWPTATPPLVPVEVEVSGERIIADPTNCQVYEIKGGDTLFGIAASFRVPSTALLAVNRLTEVSILQPGDTICIPEVIYGGELPPTPGPSPTPGPTEPPPGPQLLYPVMNASFSLDDEPVVLQWVSVKDLAGNEWYMVELTDLTDVDSHPRRAFTRQTSFRPPEEWEPDGLESHQFRWRISIVRVTGQREDGSFIYTYGGRSSEDSYFSWAGGAG